MIISETSSISDVVDETPTGDKQRKHGDFLINDLGLETFEDLSEID